MIGIKKYITYTTFRVFFFIVSNITCVLLMRSLYEIIK
jgi:hypothetical protein